MDSCTLCGEVFEWDGKKKQYRTADGARRGKCETPSEMQTKDIILEHYGYSLTPTKYQCSNCSANVKKLSTSSKTFTQSREVLSPLIKAKRLKRFRSSPFKRLTPAKRGNFTVAASITKTTTSPIAGKRVRGGMLKAKQLISNDMFGAGLAMLFHSSRKARKALSSYIKRTIREEVHALAKINNNVWRDDLFKFSTSRVKEELELEAPNLWSFLVGATTGRASESCLRVGRNKKSSLPCIAQIVGCLLNLKNKRCNTIQLLNTLQLWFGACKREPMDRLAKLGVTVSAKTVNRRIDVIRKGFDKRVIEWKHSAAEGPRTEMKITEDSKDKVAERTKKKLFVESDAGLSSDSVEDSDDGFSDIKPLEPNVNSCSDPESDSELPVHPSSPHATPHGIGASVPHPLTPQPLMPRPHLHEDAMDLADEPTEDPFDASYVTIQDTSFMETGPTPTQLKTTEGKAGYTLCFDNVNQHTTARHFSTESGNVQHNMVQSYAALNRISSANLQDRDMSLEQIKEVPLSDYVPSQTDVEEMKEDIKKEIKKILASNLSAFLPIYDTVCEARKHMYSEVSRKKSVVVPLGVMEKDETKTKEMVDILRELVKYVPLDKNGEQKQIVLWGDGLSCERVKDAQESIANAEDEGDKLLAYEPVPQEWHKRLLYVTETMEMLYNTASSRTAGTLSYIRSRFEHRGVSTTTSSCFYSSVELIEFATESYILAMAMDIMEIDTINATIDDTNLEEKAEEVASQIYDRIVTSPNSEAILKAAPCTQKRYKFCICKTQKDDFMVECSQRGCKAGKWFHGTCIGLTKKEADKIKNYFCARCTEQQKHGRKKFNNIAPSSVLDCSFEYTKALVWRGLGDMVRREAIKCNNGVAMIRHWRYDLPGYVRNGHTKYTILAHRMISGLSCMYSPRLAHDVIWNRTINVSGGSRGNIPADQHMEHLNKEYKNSSRAAGGNLTTATTDRYGQMLALKENLADVYNDLAGHKDSYRKTGGVMRMKDKEVLITLIRDESLHKDVGRKRHHLGFCSFHHSEELPKPYLFKETMERLTCRLLQKMQFVHN